MGIFSFVSLCRADAGRRRPAVLLIIIASGQRAFKENGKSMFFYTRGIAQKIKFKIKCRLRCVLLYGFREKAVL
jgi:hypothetical protein